MKSHQIVDSFSPDALALREQFESRFRDPKSAGADRFVWDYWHVPDQYTALRTPAYHYFTKKVYDRFHNQLVWWGRRNLGCHDVSPPWLSCYIDGCHQEFHGDLPHGPWAFVFSLTPWKTRCFRGGETILLRDEILDYWRKAESEHGMERDDVLTSIPALFNRLTVFDPRIPHGVRKVEGTHDPREGRLVIHGWFVQPRPFIEGPLKTRELQPVIDDLSGTISELLSQGLDVSGTLALKLVVNPSGKVAKVTRLSNSLRERQWESQAAAVLDRHIQDFLRRVNFRRHPAKSTITLPLIFD